MKKTKILISIILIFRNFLIQAQETSTEQLSNEFYNIFYEMYSLDPQIGEKINGKKYIFKNGDSFFVISNTEGNIIDTNHESYHLSGIYTLKNNIRFFSNFKFDDKGNIHIEGYKIYLNQNNKIIQNSAKEYLTLWDKSITFKLDEYIKENNYFSSIIKPIEKCRNQTIALLRTSEVDDYYLRGFQQYIYANTKMYDYFLNYLSSEEGVVLGFYENGRSENVYYGYTVKDIELLLNNIPSQKKRFVMSRLIIDFKQELMQFIKLSPSSKNYHDVVCYNTIKRLYNGYILDQKDPKLKIKYSNECAEIINYFLLNYPNSINIGQVKEIKSELRFIELSVEKKPCKITMVCYGNDYRDRPAAVFLVETYKGERKSLSFATNDNRVETTNYPSGECNNSAIKNTIQVSNFVRYRSYASRENMREYASYILSNDENNCPYGISFQN